MRFALTIVVSGQGTGNGTLCNPDGPISFDDFKATLDGLPDRNLDPEELALETLEFELLVPNCLGTRHEWYQMVGVGLVGFVRGDWERLARALDRESSRQNEEEAMALQEGGVEQAETAGPSASLNTQSNIEAELEDLAEPASAFGALRLRSSSVDSSGYEGDDETPNIRRTPVNVPGAHHAHRSVVPRSNNNNEELYDDNNEAGFTSQDASNSNHSCGHSSLDSTEVQVSREDQNLGMELEEDGGEEDGDDEDSDDEKTLVDKESLFGGESEEDAEEDDEEDDDEYFTEDDERDAVVDAVVEAANRAAIIARIPPGLLSDHLISTSNAEELAELCDIFEIPH